MRIVKQFRKEGRSGNKECSKVGDSSEKPRKYASSASEEGSRKKALVEVMSGEKARYTSELTEGAHARRDSGQRFRDDLRRNDWDHRQMVVS